MCIKIHTRKWRACWHVEQQLVGASSAKENGLEIQMYFLSYYASISKTLIYNMGYNVWNKLTSITNDVI
jgi:hypothetical protein